MNQLLHLSMFSTSKFDVKSGRLKTHHNSNHKNTLQIPHQHIEIDRDK